MAYFQTLFCEQHKNVIEYNGITYYRFWPIQVNDDITLKFKFVEQKSKYTQAIVLMFPYDFDGIVSISGNHIPIPKTSFPSLNFWEDSAPKEFDVSIKNYTGEIKICNGADPIGTKQFCKHLSEGCAMIVRGIGQGKYSFQCNDHEFEGNCENLVFELEIVRADKKIDKKEIEPEVIKTTGAQNA